MPSLAVMYRDSGSAGGSGIPATLFICVQKSIHGFLYERNTPPKAEYSFKNCHRQFLAAHPCAAAVVPGVAEDREGNGGRRGASP